MEAWSGWGAPAGTSEGLGTCAELDIVPVAVVVVAGVVVVEVGVVFDFWSRLDRDLELLDPINRCYMNWRKRSYQYKIELLYT